MSAAIKKIGLFVGSFDPPHIAHRNLVLEIRARFGLDHVYVYPDAVKTYKTGRQSLHHRQAMLDLAFENVDGIITRPPPELALAEGEEALWHIHGKIKKHHGSDQVFILMGNDTFDWYAKVAEQNNLPSAHIIVSVRNGETRDFPPALNGGTVQSFVQNDQLFSSTRIRDQLKGDGRSDDVPKNVRDYIEQYNLYLRSTMGDAQHWIERENHSTGHQGNIGIEIVANPHLYSAILKDGQRSNHLKIIDFGGGTGKLARDLLSGDAEHIAGFRRTPFAERDTWQKKEKHVVTYEKDTDLVAAGKALSNGMHLHACDLGHEVLPDADQSADIAVSRTFLMHLSEKALSHHLSEAHRILKSGAAYHIVVLNPAYQLWNLAFFGRKDEPTPHEKVDFNHGETGNLQTFHHYYRDIATYHASFRATGFEVAETSHPAPLPGWEDSHGRYYQTERPLFVYFRLVK